MTTTNASEYSYVTMSFRAFGKDARTIHEAAKSKGIATAAYMRRLVLEWAHADLGLNAPDLDAYSGQDVVAQVAHAQGLSVREFSARAAKVMAAQLRENATALEATGAKLSATRVDIDRALELARKRPSGQRRKVG